MDSSVWDRHSFVMEETSETRKERKSVIYHSDSENCGTSLKQWGEKEVKSSMSYTDVSIDSAYTSSNRLSSTCFSSCPAISFTDSGKGYSADSHPSETSCDEELLDLEELDNCHGAVRISTPNVSSIKDQHLYFQRNYTIFKEHLEPSFKLMDEIISSECRDKSFPERIREAPTRQRKADILIKYAARYLDKDSFESLLKRTEHGHLIHKLKTGSTREACLPAASDCENMIHLHLLYSKQFKELLMDEIEPRLIIDRLVELEVLRLDDHEDVLVTDYRPTRVESLMKYINRDPARNCIYFFKVLKESYPHFIHQFDTCDVVAGCESTSNFDIMTMTGGWRVPQSFLVDESAELRFHVRLSPSSPDVEMRVVDESETNMDVEYNMKLLDLQLESMQLGSIVIVHKQLTAHAIQKLQEACSTGEIKRYIKSLFTAKDVEQLRRDGVTFLVLKITAEKPQQVQQKLFKPMKTTQEAMCRNDRNFASVIPGVHSSCTDTTWMVTGGELQENASFLLDELEPKEYVNAFNSILSKDVQSRLIADFDRRERARIFLDEIVKKGQPAVDIFTRELDRLGRHHILNILRGTNTSGINADRIVYHIRTSVVNNYSVFLAELEPKIIGTFFVERRLLDNVLYEKICHLPSRRNRVVAFLKWLLDEERPDAYFAFQKAVRMFYSEKFVKLLEITEPLTEISSPAADKTNDVAQTHVLLYLARFKLIFSNDTSSSAQSPKMETFSERATDDKSGESGMVIWPLNISENNTDLLDIACKYQETKNSGSSSGSTSSASRQRQEEMMRANNDDATPDETIQASSETCMLSDLKMTEEDEKLATNDFPPNQDSEPRLLNAKALRSIQNKHISLLEKVAKWLSEQSKKSSTTDRFSIPEKTNTSYIDPDKQLLMESTSAESGQKQHLLTIGPSTICKCDSEIVSDKDSRFSKPRTDTSVVLLQPDKSNSNIDDEVSKSDIGYISNSDHADIDQMTTSSFTPSGRGTRCLETREFSSYFSEYECARNLSLFGTESQKSFTKLPIMMSVKSLPVREREKMNRKLVSKDERSHFSCFFCQSGNYSVKLHKDTSNVTVQRDSRGAISHVFGCYCPRSSP